MPELPEVETVARTLREGRGAPALIGRTIQSAQVLWGREIGNLKPRVFEKRVSGAQVTAISRHGKYLIITLTSSLRPQSGTLSNRQSAISRDPRSDPRNVPDPSSPLRGSEVGDRGKERDRGGNRKSLTMLVHLKMSGRLDVVPQDEAFSKHARVVWLLDDGLALRFDDARKFGRVWLVDDPTQIIGKLGPDALAMSEADFITSIRRKRGALKPLLLNQAFIAGVGNIYADESLHIAGLHPKRNADALSEDDATRLYDAIQRVLVEGIAANGASFDWVYPDGNFQDNFRVYGMTGKACATCGRPIERILVGQRSTHFCPDCQPL